METFGERLKRLRKKRNLDQTALANIVGLTQGAISLYERGERDPSTDTLAKLADFFDVSVDYLVGRCAVENMTAADIRTVDDLKRYLGLDDEDVVRLLFIDNRTDDQTIPPDALEHILQAIEFVRWKYGLHGEHTEKED